MMTLHHNAILPFKYFIESSDLSSSSQLSEKSISLNIDMFVNWENWIQVIFPTEMHKMGYLNWYEGKKEN